jgi:sugar phosphate isomerase/epimerase
MEIERDLDVAEMLGATLIRVGLKRAEEAALAQCAADAAAERGIRLAHQTHTASPFESAGECLTLLDRINRPNFGLIVEPANLALVGESYGAETLARLAPHIFNVYVQNLRVDSSGPQQIETNRGAVRYHRLAVGDEGGIDFAGFFTALREVGYDGWVTSHQPSLPDQEVGALADRVFRYLSAMVA